MDATNTHVSLDRSFDTSSSDDLPMAVSSSMSSPGVASSTVDTQFFNAVNVTKPASVTAPGYANPEPDLVSALYKARKLKDSERAQQEAQALQAKIPPGTLDQLFTCAATNDVDGLKKLIELGSINLHIPRLSDMRTPLMIAVINGHVDMARLLAAHAMPQQLILRDASGASALDLALDNGTVMLAQIIYNAAPGIRDHRGYTPLVGAIADRSDVRIRKLLKILPNVNERSIHGESALELAIENGMLKVTRKLLDKGALVDEKDRARNDPLSFAARFGFADIVALLCTRGAAVDRQNKDGNTPLQFAAWGGHQLAVQRLLQHGANPNLQDNAGATPLYAAASRGHTAIIRMLVQFQARVDLADVEDHTPLHMAALAGHAEAVEALINAGASIDPIDRYGRTPLQYAVEKNHSACVRLLLSHKADINHADVKGHTALDIHEEHDGVADVGDVLHEYGARRRCCRPCVIL